MPHISIVGHGALYYHEIPGGTDRPWLLFLHEGLGCAAMWREFPARLCQATGCRGLVYDRLGHGRSSPLSRKRTATYLHAAAEHELAAVIARLIPDQDYVVVGHSDGGSIGLIHAAQQPTGLRGLITESAHVLVEDLTLDGIRATVAAFAVGGLRAGLARHHGDKTAELFAAWAETWLSEPFRAWDITDLLERITCPLLAIQGRDDQYGTALQVELIAARAPRAKAVLLDACGHAPHREQAAVLDLMREFIDCHRVSSSPEPCAGGQDCPTMAARPVFDQERDRPPPAPDSP